MASVASLDEDSSAKAKTTPPPRPSPFISKLNSSTKWIVTLANTIGIWIAPSIQNPAEGPFIVVGAILSVYFTDVLKKIINNERPAGAPFADPGMPSSHSLVSFFLAAAWSTLLLTTISSSAIAGTTLLWASASLIALLRVMCGYHSYAQIGVGAILGSGMGFSWAKLGMSFMEAPQRSQFVFQVVSWSSYIMLSALFIGKNMRDWLHKDKHL
eukprot:CAMPEP_0194042888 /NCGR_PEP_ID=MMETSP0009_2-20130614/14616_1 /TAXON_ID=210454 /ORGANISM="Grammatophora oceanica, Strain CCMP 410" /LENGTH=212 /DNA_ID=CAMNT_0038686917 /DNA_START=298 /DNA_END=936 /DNA_ORIENTATION=+